MNHNRRITLGDRGFHERPPRFLKGPRGVYLTFGKHADKKLADVPLSYLHWLQREISDADLAAEVDIEIRRRNEGEGEY